MKKKNSRPASASTYSLWPYAAGLAFAALCAWGLFAARAQSPALPAAQYASGALEAFAGCLSEKGATMYGASWCPHCQKQKKEFGEAFKFVKYVECSLGDAPQSNQAPACEKAGVTGYPTWIFADGSRGEGELPFAMLAYKSGCPAPSPLGNPVPDLTGSAAQR